MQKLRIKKISNILFVMLIVISLIMIYYSLEETREERFKHELQEAKARLRKPAYEYYQTGKVASHDPVNADDLGLTWQLPLQPYDINGAKIESFGRAYCPTMKGSENGVLAYRYNGMHRGHDLGVTINELGGIKIPVHVIADGVYDGQRINNFDEDASLECKPLVVYHFPKDDSRNIYTSIYCHVDPNPDLVVGQKLKAGDVLGTLEDPNGAWNAQFHLELYTRPVYSSKGSTKRISCNCSSDSECDATTKNEKAIPGGCGIFEDDLYLLEPVLFINNNKKG
jgi:hypothetical protein